MPYVKVDHPVRECEWCRNEYKPRTSHQNFCNRMCYKRYGKKYKGHSNGLNLNHYTKSKKDTCEKCGFVPEHKCQLDVDHIDGNHNNNNKDNLQTLCANCHRLKTFLSREGIYKNAPD